jgi:Pentapeptide repeats (8 copies)
MTSKLRSWWLYIKKHWVVAIVMTLAIAFVLIIYAGYQFSWEWTGLGPETSEPKQHAKTLWDWLNLLGVFAVPAVVGFGAAWYTAQQGKVSEKENTDNQRETALQEYIDKMSDLLLGDNTGLHSPTLTNPGSSEVRNVARVRTLTILHQLDRRRKGNVIQFLSEAGLVTLINLGGVNLANATLRWAHLENAQLDLADMSSADLREAYLSGANLLAADLTKADLTRADLRGTNLTDVKLEGAILQGARYNTNVIQEKNAQEEPLQPTRWPDGFSNGRLEKEGAICVDC